jgi:hypothetical protein
MELNNGGRVEIQVKIRYNIHHIEDFDSRKLWAYCVDFVPKCISLTKLN